MYIFFAFPMQRIRIRSVLGWLVNVAYGHQQCQGYNHTLGQYRVGEESFQSRMLRCRNDKRPNGSVRSDFSALSECH